MTPPRVVVLTPYFHPIIGGVESNAARFARHLHSIGTPVQVLTKRISSALPDDDELDGIRIRRIGPRADRSPAGKWAMSPAVFWWLLRHSTEYDVVCVIDYRGVGIPAIVARALTERRVMVQAQTPGVLSADGNAALGAAGLPIESSWARTLKAPVRAVYRRADAFACISHGLEREAVAAGVPPWRVHFLPNAVDMQRFRPPAAAERHSARGRLGVSEQYVVCLFVGRLSREKGVMDLIEAWRLIQPVPAVLIVAGPDMTGNAWNVGPSARESVERYGLSESVRFYGPCDDVASLLHAADVVVQPSHFEALGLSAVEALAAGVPVVASAVGGLLDFVSDGGNGRLAAPQNPPSLAAALREIILDPALRRRLSAAARPSVAEYDEKIVFGRMLDLLTTLASTRTR